MIARVKHTTEIKNVSSFGVNRIEYEESTQTLKVELTNNHHATGNQVVSHGPVPKAVFDAFVKAASKGGFYNKEIRNKYPHLNTEG